MNSWLHISMPKKVFVIITLLFWAFLFFRASILPISSDEAASWLDIHYMHLNYIFGGTTNAHLPISLWFYICEKFIGTANEVILRLPSLVAFPIFTYFSYKLAIRSRSPLLVFLYIISQAYLLDFFVLARGYALAITFFVGILTMLTANEKDFNHKSLSVTFALMLLCNLSIYSMFVVNGLLLLFYLIYLLQKQFIDIKKGFRISFVYVLIHIPIIFILWKLSKLPLLIYFPFDFFYQSVLSIYQLGYRDLPFDFYWLIIVLNIIIIIIGIYYTLSHKDKRLNIILLSVFAWVVFSWFIHFFLAIPYVAFRGLFFLWILIAAIYILLIDHINALKVILALLILVHCYQFFLHPYQTRESYFNNDVKNAIVDLEKLPSKSRLGCSPWVGLSLQFYRHQGELSALNDFGWQYHLDNTYLEKFYFNYVNHQGYDYWLLLPQDTIDDKALPQFKLLKQYPNTGLMLLENTN